MCFLSHYWYSIGSSVGRKRIEKKTIDNWTHSYVFGSWSIGTERKPKDETIQLIGWIRWTMDKNGFDILFYFFSSLFVFIHTSSASNRSSVKPISITLKTDINRIDFPRNIETDDDGLVCNFVDRKWVKNKRKKNLYILTILNIWSDLSWWDRWCCFTSGLEYKMHWSTSITKEEP